MYTVYTYWNSEGVIAVLNAIVLIMGGGSYLGLARTFAIAGMLVAAGAGMAKFSAKEPLQYFIFLALFYFGLFVPKVTVDVIDVQTGQVGTVANVPFGVAFFYSSTSKIGKYLTESYETAFQPVANLRFGKTGLGFGARAFQEVAGARSGDPRLSEALREFTRGCINPEIIEDTQKYEELVKSTDVFGTIMGSGWLNPGRSVNIPVQGSGAYAYMPCIAGAGSSAGDTILAWLLVEAGQQQTWIARRLFPDKANPSAGWAAATATIGAALADSEGYLLANARSATAQITQGMMVNAVNDSAGSLAIARNDPSAMQAALAAKMAEMQANGAYRTSALIGEAALPKFRNIVEIVIIAVFPIVMLLIIMAGDKGGAVLKTYVITTIWIQLWAPLYAVVNFMMLGGMSSRFQASLDGATSQTMMNTAAITMTAFKESSLAGSLVFAIPVIAYALVKGGEVAMSGAMGSLTSTAQGAASSSGSSAAMGNVSAGSVGWNTSSMNNMSANKSDNTGALTQGSYASTTGGVLQGGSMGGAMGGRAGVDSGKTSMAGVQSDFGGYSAMATSAFGSAAQSQMTSSMRSGNDAITQMSNTLSAGFGLSSGATARSGSASDVAATWQTGKSSQSGSGFDKSLTDSVKFGQSAGFSVGESVNLAASTGAGTKGFAKMVGDLASKATASPAIKKLAGQIASIASADLEGSFKSDAGLKQAYDSARSAGDTEAFKSGVSTALTGGSGTSASNKSTAGTEKSSGKSSSYDDIAAAQNTARQSYQKADDISNSSSNSAQGGAQISANMANAAQAQLGGEGFAKMFSPGNEQAAGAYLQGLAKEMVQSLGGGFTPQPGSAPQAGGQAGAQLAAAATAATTGGGGNPPAFTPQQVDNVQGKKGDNDAAVGKGPSSKPAPVAGEGGAPVTQAGVQAESGARQAAAAAETKQGGRNVTAAVNNQREASQGKIEEGASSGGLLAPALATTGNSIVNLVSGGSVKLGGDITNNPAAKTGGGMTWRQKAREEASKDGGASGSF